MTDGLLRDILRTRRRIVTGTAGLLGLALASAVTAARSADGAYDVTTKGTSAHVVSNAGQAIAARFSSSGVEISGLGDGADWRMQQTLRGFGARGDLATLAEAELSALGSRIDYARSPGVSEWYVNSPEGLQQWFAVHRAPEDSAEGSPLVLDFGLDGDLSFEVDGAGRVLNGIDTWGHPAVTTHLWQVRTASGRAPYVEMSLTRDPGGVVDGFTVTAQLAEADYPVTLALATGHPKLLELRLEDAHLARGMRSGDAAGQPLVAPANDTCAAAQIIPGAGPFPYLTSTVNLLDATASGDPTITCAFQDLYSRGVWYRFTPTQTGLYSLSTCAAGAPGTTRADTVLAVFTLNGSCGTASTQLACDDDSCTTLDRQSSTSLVLNAGTNYYVVVYSYGTTAPPAGSSDVQVRVEKLPPPQNDTCSNPTTLPLGALTGTNLIAANDYSLSGTACFTGLGQTSCTAAGRDTVYRFTAPTAGSYSFRVRTIDANGSGNVVLYSTPTCPVSPGAITCSAPVRAANRTASSAIYAAAEEILCQPMTAGQVTYLVADECAATAAGGAYTIEAWPCGLETEANNTPATANAFNVCPMEGASNVGGDADFFSLGTPAAGTRVFAVADAIPSNDADFDLRVTTSADTLEYDDENNASPWGELGPNVAGTPLTGAASYLRLNHHVNNRIAEPYQVFRVLQPPGADPYGSSSSPEQRDLDNDSLEGAEAAGNYYYRGTLTDIDDLDAFRFCAVAGDWITISTDMNPGRNSTPIDGLGLLFDENATLLVSQQDAANASSTSTMPGTGNLSATTPFANAEIVVWRAQYTGAYYAGTAAGGTSLPTAANADYLLSIGLNCQNGASHSALVTTSLTAPASVQAGDPFSYHVVLSNTGTHSGLDVQFTDVLPAGVEFLEVTGAGSDHASCDLLPAVGSSGTVRCKVECLRAGGSYDFAIVVRATPCVAGSILANSVTATSLTALAPGSVLDGGAVTAVTHTPAEIGGATFPNKTTFSWVQNAAASRYDIVRGPLSGLPVGPGGGGEICFGNISNAFIIDSMSPAPGAGFSYVVRGENTCSPPGTYGSDSLGNPRTTTTCP